MTSTNMTFPIAAAGAILAEEAHREMPIAQANSRKADEAQYEAQYWDAVIARDTARDGEFVFAVATTGVYCRPSCPARRPRRENVTFYSHPAQAERAGFRACLRCRPRSVSVNPQSDLAKEICRY